MKYTIQKTDFNIEKQTYYCEINTSIGSFIGYCKLHEEDKDIVSNFFGYKVAEMRALLKYKKAYRKILIAKENLLFNILKQLEDKKDYNTKSTEAKFLRKNYYMIKQERLNLDDNIKLFGEHIYNDLKNYRENWDKAQAKITKQQNKHKDNETNN